MLGNYIIFRSPYRHNEFLHFNLFVITIMCFTSKFRNHWRDAISKTSSPSVLSMAIYILDSSIAWDKSVMKASCQLCKGMDNDDKLLLCDACDRGYHTYCFKPPLENIPDGDCECMHLWLLVCIFSTKLIGLMCFSVTSPPGFCWECINKATGNKCCIVCGKGVVANVKLLCEFENEIIGWVD